MGVVQPHHRRFDAAVVIRDALSERVPDAVVELGRDATYRPEQFVTVVQTPTVSALGAVPGQRWVFEVSLRMDTSGPVTSNVLDVHDAVAEAVLSLDDWRDFRFSSVVCRAEPTVMASHNPTGAAMVGSTYSLILRRINNG